MSLTCDASMSTVCAPSHLRGTVDLDVVNDQMVSVQSLDAETKW